MLLAYILPQTGYVLEKGDIRALAQNINPKDATEPFQN